MSEIIVTGTDEKQEELEELKYQPKEEDEEMFFLMYHLNFQPSEVANLDADYRKWLCARFIAQKNLEREAMERHRLMSAIGPNLGNGSGLRLHE
jgi:hypothetical protein